MSVTIRKATRLDLQHMIDWAASEGWNPGLDDLPAFWLADPAGYHVLERDGRIVSAISLVHHQHDFAFLGFYIVDPELRGQGYGHRLWQDVLAESQAITIGLDGVVDQQANYTRSGFALAHRNRRFGGNPQWQRVSVRDAIAPVPMEMLEQVIAYDARHSPSPRADFASAWYSDTDTRHSLLLTDDRGTIRGLGTIRACREGCRIGPLFADDAEKAAALFSQLLTHAGDGPVYIDCPEPNGEAEALARKAGLAPVFETARMYRGTMPSLPLERIFGITTFELG